MTRLDSSHCKQMTRLNSSLSSKRLDSTRVNARKTRVPKSKSLFLCEEILTMQTYGAGKYILHCEEIFRYFTLKVMAAETPVFYFHNNAVNDVCIICAKCLHTWVARSLLSVKNRRFFYTKTVVDCSVKDSLCFFLTSNMLSFAKYAQ